jgi:hypothetical protein
MRQQNIDILEAQRPRVELFFNTGSLHIAVGMNACDHCIDGGALVQVMRQEFEPSADLNPYAGWNEPDGYKGFFSRLYAHYDAWKAKNPSGDTNGLCTNQSI